MRNNHITGISSDFVKFLVEHDNNCDSVLEIETGITPTIGPIDYCVNDFRDIETVNRLTLSVG